MSKTFQLDIITPTKVISLGQTEYLRAPSNVGLFGVQAGHAPATMLLDIGEIKVTQNGKDSFYATNGGFADIQPEGVILLIETVESADEIDAERSSSALRRANEHIKEKDANLSRARAALKRAQNRMKIASR